MNNKNSIDLNAFHTFITTVKLGNMTKAAQYLGVSVQTVSRCINELEIARNCKLFYKKKPLLLSPVGKRYFKELNKTFNQTTEAINELDNEYLGECGQLTIHAPYNLTRVILADILIDFACQFPNIKVTSIAVDDTMKIDMEGADLAFSLVDEAPDDWVAKKIGSYTSRLYASPDYLKTAKPINGPEQLEEHKLILYKNQEHWLLTKDEENFSLKIKKANFIANQMEILYKATAKGLGIGHLVDWVAKPLIESGVIVPVLPDWQQNRNAYLLYPHRHYLPKRVKCFIDFIIPQLEKYKNQ